MASQLDVIGLGFVSRMINANLTTHLGPRNHIKRTTPQGLHSLPVASQLHVIGLGLVCGITGNAYHFIMLSAF
eukprot:10928603-Lingulodinium_polyedra.AAC.1